MERCRTIYNILDYRVLPLRLATTTLFHSCSFTVYHSNCKQLCKRLKRVFSPCSLRRIGVRVDSLRTYQRDYDHDERQDKLLEQDLEFRCSQGTSFKCAPCRPGTGAHSDHHIRTEHFACVWAESSSYGRTKSWSCKVQFALLQHARFCSFSQWQSMSSRI